MTLARALFFGSETETLCTSFAKTWKSCQPIDVALHASAPLVKDPRGSEKMEVGDARLPKFRLCQGLDFKKSETSTRFLWHSSRKPVTAETFPTVASKVWVMHGIYWNPSTGPMLPIFRRASRAVASPWRWPVLLRTDLQAILPGARHCRVPYTRCDLC